MKGESDFQCHRKYDKGENFVTGSMTRGGTKGAGSAQISIL